MSDAMTTLLLGLRAVLGMARDRNAPPVVPEPEFKPFLLPSRHGAVPMCCKLAVHEVDAVGALVGGEPDAAPKQVQEHVAMASEHRSEHVGLPFVRSEPFQFFAGTAAPVIEQHCRKRSVARRAPE